MTPDRECVDASTSNWRIPVSISIGSSIGAVLALFLIMLMVVAVARCPFAIRCHDFDAVVVPRSKAERFNNKKFLTCR